MSSIKIRNRTAAAAAVFVSLLFCVFVLYAYASEADTVHMQVTYGYDNSAKGGRYLPVSVSAVSRRNEDFSGTLQIRSIESDGSVYQYDFQADIRSGEETILKEYVPLGTRATQLCVRLLDENGKILADEQIKLNVSWDVPELFIGILSDEPQKLRYLDGIGISYGMMRTRTFDLEEEEISSDETGLNLLDVLVVNNYRLRNLSESQTFAIMDWVHGGGVLVLGTGERVDDTLGRFAPELLDDSYDTPSLRQINLGENFQFEDAGAAMMKISCVDIPLHGGNVIISSDGMGLLTAASKEQGLIGVTAFDLADISEFCERETSYADYFLTQLIGEERIRQLAEVVYSGNSSRYDSVEGLIDTGNVEKLPNLPLYAGVVLMYLFLLGPGLYLYLKNRGLQIFYRRGVALLAAVFTVLIYLFGSATRFRTTFYTYATILDSTDDYITDTTYVNVRNPYNGSYEIALDPQYSVLPITKTGKGTYQENQQILEQEDYQIEIDRRQEELKIRGHNITAFSPRYFHLEKKTSNTDKIGIVGQIEYFGGKLTGMITNQFPYALENAALVLYGGVVYLDRLEAGETRILDELSLIRFPLNRSQALAERITGQREFSLADIGDTGYLLAMKRSGLLKFYLDNYMTGYTADAKVIAFRTEKEESGFLRETSPETYGITMLTASIGVNASQESRLYRSVLMKTPRVLTGQYDARTNTMSGVEPLTLEYQMGTDIFVESLTLEAVSEEFLSEGEDGPIELFTGSIYLYNYGTGSFDPAKSEMDTMDIEYLQPYLSSENTLTVRYVYEGTGKYDNIQLPMPMAAGREQ